jgi:hypothetical protein
MHLPLINADAKVKLCRDGFGYLKKKQMAEGWRLHSAGYAVLQYTELGKIRTFYLHKVLADRFVPKPDTDKRLFVHMVNGNKLDCRLDNLQWLTMNELRRRQQSSSEGFRGVSKDGDKFRAVLYDGGRRIYLGLYETEEAAARAYDEASFRRFGYTNSLNFKDSFEASSDEGG